ARMSIGENLWLGSRSHCANSRWGVERMNTDRAREHRIRIGGVPEHFNVPWHVALESSPEVAGWTVEWRDYPGGTGDMCRAMERDEIDVAVLLTEGVVRHIHDGGPARLVGTYTASPLIWGIHVAADG